MTVRAHRQPRDQSLTRANLSPWYRSYCAEPLPGENAKSTISRLPVSDREARIH